MTKKAVMITIDEGLHKQAKENYLNISGISEKALREKLNKKQIEVNISEDETKCAVCGKVEPKATKSNMMGMTWLWPDERWVCKRCLKMEKVAY